MSFNRPDIIRPPSEWKGYFLHLTSGCSNNSCAFCGYYGSKLQIRDVSDIKSEIDALCLFTRNRISLPSVPKVVYAVAQDWDGTRIFLQDGDALVYAFPRLREVLRYLNEKMPVIEGIGTCATSQDIVCGNSANAGPLKTAASEGILGYLDYYLFAEQLTLGKKALTTDDVANTVVSLLSGRSGGINAQGIKVSVRP